MKYILSVFATLVLLLGGFLALLFFPKGKLEKCASAKPTFNNNGVGYEFIDPVKREVWATTDFTPDEYAKFSFPVHWLFWFKNGPRTLLADGGEFLRSPGCGETGQFTFMEAFDKRFLKVVQLVDMSSRSYERGLIRRVELEKYHVLTYREGQTVNILANSGGERFIGVSRKFPQPKEPPSLPESWNLATFVLDADIQVNLFGKVSVLRLDNEDSFQGPLPPELEF